MCDSCLTRAEKLRDIVVRFEALAAEGGEPLFSERLTRTARELSAIASQLSTCSCDVVWVETADPPEPVMEAQLG
jgi:hypothetical protein